MFINSCFYIALSSLYFFLSIMVALKLGGDATLYIIALPIVLSLIQSLHNKDIAKILFLIFFILFIIVEPFIYLFKYEIMPTWFEQSLPSVYLKYEYFHVVNLFMGSYYLGLFFSSLRYNRVSLLGVTSQTKSIRSNTDLKRFGYLALLFIFALGLYPYLKNGLNGMIILLLSGREDGFSQFDIQAVANTNFLSILSNFLIATGVISAYLLCAKCYESNLGKILLILILLLSTLIIASGGGRTRVGFIIVPSLFLYISYTSFRIKEKVKVIVFSLASLLLIFSMVSIRDQGVLNSEDIKFELKGFNLNRELAFILSNKDEFPLACKSTITCTIIAPIETTLKFVTNPIPRFYYEGKYLDPSFAFYNKLRLGDAGLYKGSNITPTAIGRYFMLYGIPGVFFIGILFGFLSEFCDSGIRKNNYVSTFKIIMLTMLSYYLAQSVRDFNPGWLYPLLFTAISFPFIIGEKSDRFNRP
ncbi:oligosaccharide repeat unit polymerase [Grimontia hollisae]|uniref:Oligosaccharide repeat unit polymerase n=1 Tax=Grimontia hollisae CIP 101886 TaxID=675812 RepID=D0IC01_GRIHO|nr:O-antigen polymerase [Grimontia hollisae]AMG29790.1 oligosaccharide repeat unit polymerase [Grimontia hollisae]EEY71419.1 hypothetical protein VHA_003280 [Grimontia hollisae CIP 101886]STO43352.1 Uncharacterised protein [Grimontia hollisae]